MTAVLEAPAAASGAATLPFDADPDIRRFLRLRAVNERCRQESAAAVRGGRAS